jgi:hypothetical protein
VNQVAEPTGGAAIGVGRIRHLDPYRILGFEVTGEGSLPFASFPLMGTAGLT